MTKVIQNRILSPQLRNLLGKETRVVRSLWLGIMSKMSQVDASKYLNVRFLYDKKAIIRPRFDVPAERDQADQQQQPQLQREQQQNMSYNFAGKFIANGRHSD